jgi:hypothetical protein
MVIAHCIYLQLGAETSVAVHDHGLLRERAKERTMRDDEASVDPRTKW